MLLPATHTHQQTSTTWWYAAQVDLMEIQQYAHGDKDILIKASHDVII